MLSVNERRPLPSLDRLTAVPVAAGGENIDWSTPIDRDRWFFCETLTPLYYTPVYAELDEAHRRRYNQLTAMLATEVIALLETEFLHAALSAVEATGSHDPTLQAAVTRFRDDEQRHADIWRRLNLLSEPDWYNTARRHFVRVPWVQNLVSRLIASRPILFPVMFWLQLVQEERSVEMSRRCMRMPADRIEPRYAAAFAAHIHDEVRHVHIDRHLIERFYEPRPWIVRTTTARLLKTVISSLLLVPVRSTGRVVDALALDFPALHPLVPRIRRELRALETNREYHEMMYSRRTTPITFALFDRYDEFHQMSEVLLAYEPFGSAVEPIVGGVS